MTEIEIMNRHNNELLKVLVLQDVVLDILRLDLNEVQILASIEGRILGHKETADMLAKQLEKV